MNEFLKKHGTLILLAIAIAAILFLVRALDRAGDEAIAQLMADRVLAKEKARAAAIEAKYQALNAAQDTEIETLQQGRKLLSANVGRWASIAEARQQRIKNLQGCIVLLDECQAKVIELRATYNMELEKTDTLWRDKVALKDAEILEWKTKDVDLTTRYADAVKRVVKLELKLRRKLIIGPQVGYGLGGTLHAGIGITYEVVRLKMPRIL